MKILFLDHAFHNKTKSSTFFLGLIRDNFNQVDVEYVDPDSLFEIKALQSKRVHDLVILWQLDYLAPVFLSAGYRTVVVPMYDGSANMPFEHWIGMGQASFVNFSRTLHERVIAAGCRSFLVKYYLPPVKEEQLPAFEDLRGILWMRRPQDGLTPKLIQGMIGNQLSALHVHNAPDDEQPRSLDDPQYGASTFKITETRWSRNTNVYLDALANCNVFFAPRLAEGIGMAMLEAFSRGMLVIANDDAVHNEYVSNWVNGILFNKDNASHFVLPLDMARGIAFSGWCGAVSGYQEWLDTRQQLVEFVRGTPEPALAVGPISPAFVTALCDAYMLGGEAYRHFLREHVVDWENRNAIKKIATSLVTLLGIENQSPPIIDEDGLFFGSSPRSVGRKFGLKEYDAFSAHLANDTLGFSVKLSSFNDTNHNAYIVLDCNLIEETKDGWTVLIHVNRGICTRLSLPTLPGEFEIRIPMAGILESDFDVMLSLLNIGSENRAADLPKIKFSSIRIEEDGVIDQ
ncbi:MAG: glycosyltransferase [Gammaproteobacteria bacterium]|nr:glycosyltransferase [Gammaproteobacteria bacterium]MBU1654564.1 glycosyltransferase [Gammaproteobacteria bacterium]MBU1961956.1 glycosyltransferase [Gammaproteobacteria bacterium]